MKKDYTNYTNEELLEEDKKMKSFAMVNALMIGFLAAIIFYSIIKKSWSMLSLIPIYFIYKLITNPKNKDYKQLQIILKERKFK